MRQKLLEHITNRKEELKQSLLTKRQVNPRTECWEWQGQRTKQNYGRYWIWYNLNSHAGIRVHRLAAFLWLDFDLQSALLVCHHCDNPPCFNPSHFLIGTGKDNMQDALKKGRLELSLANLTHVQHGEFNNQHKLTTANVIEIRNLIKQGIGQRILAERYGVTHFTIGAISTRRTWKHIL